jgi:hypothetical protein
MQWPTTVLVFLLFPTLLEQKRAAITTSDIYSSYSRIFPPWFPPQNQLTCRKPGIYLKVSKFLFYSNNWGTGNKYKFCECHLTLETIICYWKHNFRPEINTVHCRKVRRVAIRESRFLGFFRFSIKNSKIKL